LIIKRRLIVRVSFVLDIGLYASMLLFRWHWFPSLILTEAVMWMVRLVWISPAMLRFVLRRMLHMVPIILSVVAIGFFLIYLAPGDVFSALALDTDIRPETLEQFRRNFGLDQPWYVQFSKYVWNALRGDFGFSQLFKAPVFVLVSQRALATLMLALCSFAVAWLFSVPAGIFAATHQYQWQDQAISVLAFFGLSIPNFFLAFLLLYGVSTTGNWLPIGGLRSLNYDELNAIEKFWDIGKHLIIPTFVISTSVMASLTRIMRANMLEIMSMQYITTARAKGLTRGKVIYKHALRNAINPMITIFGFQLGALLGGAALVEQVTAWPGLGKLILTAVLNQDLYLVMGSLVYSVGLLVVGNLIADILLAIVDPRVRVG
jgi:peptide/nickel transport system permease protein